MQIRRARNMSERQAVQQRCKKIGVLVTVALCSVSIFPLCALAGQVRPTREQAAPDFRPVRVVPTQRPITQFPTRQVRDAYNALNPSELVLGVTVNDESRAYPINMLTGPRREILNDTVGGQAIVATW